MRTLVRYSWHATWSIFVGTGVVMTAVLFAPWQLRRVMAVFVLLWFGACALYCLAIWFSAACTPEGRSSVAPWASGIAVVLKVMAIITLFGDNIRRLFERPVEGRPLRTGRKTHRTEVTAGGDWSCSENPGSLLPEPALAGVDWLRLAGDEHASVGAFSRLSLELLAAGAPPELVAGVHRAALEEIEHARLCYRVASLVSGTPCSAAPLPAAVAPFELPTSRVQLLGKLARESLTDGWLNEGAAARAIERLAARAQTPWLRDALAEVARQERGHSELGARIAAWCTGLQREIPSSSSCDADLASATVSPM